MSTEAQKQYHREWRRRKWANDPEYRERKKATDKAWRDRMRAELQAYKLDAGCARCGYSECARALQFHHLDDDKELTIGNAIQRGRKRLWEEVAKCEVLRANCHAQEHCEADC